MDTYSLRSNVQCFNLLRILQGICCFVTCVLVGVESHNFYPEINFCLYCISIPTLIVIISDLLARFVLMPFRWQIWLMISTSAFLMFSFGAGLLFADKENFVLALMFTFTAISFLLDIIWILYLLATIADKTVRVTLRHIGKSPAVVHKVTKVVESHNAVPVSHTSHTVSRQVTQGAPPVISPAPIQYIGPPAPIVYSNAPQALVPASSAVVLPASEAPRSPLPTYRRTNRPVNVTTTTTYYEKPSSPSGSPYTTESYEYDYDNDYDIGDKLPSPGKRMAVTEVQCHCVSQTTVRAPPPYSGPVRRFNYLHTPTQPVRTYPQFEVIRCPADSDIYCECDNLPGYVPSSGSRCRRKRSGLF